MMENSFKLDKQESDAVLTQTKHSLPIALLRTRELIMEEVRPMLLQHDITEQQWRVLRVISEDDGADATTIADRACIFAPSLTRILRKLSKKDFVQIMKDPKDRRRNRVKMTEKGRSFIQEVAPESLILFKALRKKVGNKRWEMLVELLGEIRDDLNMLKRDRRKKR